MSNILKNYMDLTNITAYDTLIKQYISEEDAKAYHTILLSVDEETLLFFKKDNATTSDIPDFQLSIGALATSIILNGTDVTGTEINIFAPTNAGTAGQILTSAGSNNAPTWNTLGVYVPEIDGDSLKFTFTNPMVNSSSSNG